MSWGVFGSITEAMKFPRGNQDVSNTPPFSMLCSCESMLRMLELQTNCYLCHVYQHRLGSTTDTETYEAEIG